MHPLFATRWAFPAYMLAWTGLSLVPAVVLGASPAFGHEVLALLATWGLSLVSLPGYYLFRALSPGARGLGRVLGAQAGTVVVWALTFSVLLELAARVCALWPVWRGLPEVVTSRRAELFGVGVLLSLLALTFHYLLLSVETRARAREREASLLLARQRAELGALRAQVHPHFLFNSLNTVSALIGYDPDSARKACIDLGAYLRKTLDAGERPFVSLAEEWELAQTYLDVEALRLGERLQVDGQLDPAALGALVPSLLLQPLIENAITHGVSQTSDPSPLTVRASLRDDRLQIEIENPLGEPGQVRVGVGGGLGLANVRARLFAHYGSSATLIATRQASTFLARLTFPARPETARALPAPALPAPADSEVPA